MDKNLFKKIAISCALTFACQFHSSVVLAQDSTGSAELFERISRNSELELVETTALQFDSYHPQGMTKVGENYFLSAVETIESPTPIPANGERYDRSTGSGVGHLFKFNAEGTLIDQVSLGEGSMYHPGGIDFDGEYIWVSVAEYRPDSHSIVYRVDPADLQVEEIFRFDDHLGAIVHNPFTSTLHALNWGARNHYAWKGLNGVYRSSDFELVDAGNSNVEYQDCQRLDDSFMLCSGLSSVAIDNTHTFTIGAIDLIDLQTNRVSHQFSFTNTTGSGELLSRNPFYFEAENSETAYFHFVPEDNRANLYTYGVTP